MKSPMTRSLQKLALPALLLWLAGCATQTAQPPAPVPVLTQPGTEVLPTGPQPVAVSRPAQLSLPPADVPVLAQGGATAAAAEQRRPVLDRNGNEVLSETTRPDGARMISFEWIMLVTPEQRAVLDGEASALMGFLRARRPFGLNNGELLLFSVPPDLDAGDAILNLVPPALRGQIDRNHLYSPRGADADAEPLPRRLLDALSGRKAALPLRLPLRAVCEAPLSVGMVDARVDLQHAVFAGLHEPDRRVISASFVEAGLEQPAAHGTAVAALWLGRHRGSGAAGALQPLLPGATLYSASVFHAGPQQQDGASAMRVLEALDWLSQQDDLRVINMSLAGPPNRLLEQTITTLSARDIHVVAAVGNEGPHGAPRYPAAYDEVVAVAATDRDGGIFRWSNQGSHVDYSAIGVDLPTAAADQPVAPQSGTSLAAPVVAAFLACALDAEGSLPAALQSLDVRVIDLGEPGSDPVYGKGLLHP